MGILGHEDHEKEVVGSGGLLLMMSRLLRRESWVGWKVGMARISHCFHFFLFYRFRHSCHLVCCSPLSTFTWLRTTVPFISLRLTLSKKRRKRQRKRRRRLQPRKSNALNTKEYSLVRKCSKVVWGVQNNSTACSGEKAGGWSHGWVWSCEVIQPNWY